MSENLQSRDLVLQPDLMKKELDEQNNSYDQEQEGNLG